MPIKILLALFLFIPNLVFAQGMTGGPRTSSAPLNVNDGSTSCYPYSIAVSSGTLTCANGIATVNTGGGSGSGNVGIGTPTIVPVYVGSTTVGPSSQIYIVGGNLGITSAAPGANLDIQGNARTTGDIQTTTGNVSIGTLTGRQLGITTASTTTGGGIATNTNAAREFDWGIWTSGDSSTNSRSYAAFRTIATSNGGSNGNIGLFTSDYGPHLNETMTLLNNTSHTGNVGINSTVPGQNLDINGTARIRADNSFYFGDLNSTSIRATNTATPTLVLNAGSSDIVYMTAAGNFGIGTSNPGTLLDVAGTTRTTGFQLSGNGAASGSLLTSNASGVGTWMPTSTLPFGTGTVTSITALAPLTGGVITTSGSIGISSTGTGSNVVLQTSPTLITPALGVATATSITTTGNIGIGTTFINGGLVVMNQNVGIGTYNPTFPLQVMGNIGVGTYTVCTQKGTECPQSASSSTNPGGSAPQLQYASNATTFGGIGSGGTDGTNIGVGTVSFKNRLNIVGNVGISTLANSPYVTNTLASPGAMVVEGNVGIGTWLTPGGSLIVKTGNVGIGTDSPGFSLDTNGGIRALGSGNSQFNTTSGNFGVGTTLTLNKVDLAGATAIGLNYAGAQTAPTNGLIVQGNVGIGTFLTSAGGFIVMTNNVGIGTWTTANKVDINGNASLGTYAGIVANGAPAGGLNMSGNLGVGTWTSGANKITVYGGNVGIGTVTSNAILNLNGGINAIGIGTTAVCVACWKNHLAGCFANGFSGGTCNTPAN